MFGYFDYDKLSKLASEKNEAYKLADPFPHCSIDDFAIEEKLSSAHSEFPKPGDLTWWAYDNVFEKKLAFDKIQVLPKSIKEVLLEMNSSPFLSFLEQLTGIKGLIPDPHYAGGGLHQIPKGGKLGVHADFNWLTRLQLHRRVNVILYMNKNWEESYGGHLELWDKEMEKCHEKILPIFNRMVCFNTTDFSYHGHPDPLTCPEGETRKSLALYYYTVDRPKEEISESHSTIYKRRPTEEYNEEIEKLRAARAKGRIQDMTTHE